MKLAALFVLGATLPVVALACSDASQLPIVQGPPPTNSANEIVMPSGVGPLTASVAPQGRGTFQDRKISDTVRAALMQDPALAQVALDRLRIETKQGKVSVSGVLATDPQHQAVLLRVKQTPGVTAVDDRIEVLPAS